ncbi:MAG: serine/threonine protein kinase [Lentisphaeria bacterium]|nr:serine/threonine protein kinase [Lentisphaeria bacterium]
MKIKLSCRSCFKNLLIEGAGDLPTFIECPNCGANIRTPNHLLNVGDKLGNFEIIRHLGSGAMGTVYLANQVSIDRLTALKVLGEEITQNPKELDSFFREVRMMGRLNHPNIVTAFEAGDNQGIHYVAMTYIDGLTLEEMIEQEGPIPTENVVFIISKIADALAYAWDHHTILHRDVKPANIMINTESEPLLLDMGISTFQSESEKDAGLVVGTPHFMSPEQTMGSSDLDHRSDMYAMGCAVFYLLTGKVPYDDVDFREVLRMQREEPTPKLADYIEGIHPNFQSFLNKTMAKDRDKRFATWGDFKKALETVFEEPKSPPPVVKPQQAARKMKSNRLRSSGAHKIPKKKSSGMLSFVIIFLVLVMIGGLLIFNSIYNSSSNKTLSSNSGDSTVPKVSVAEKKIELRFEQIRDDVLAVPDRAPNAILKLNKLIEDSQGFDIREEIVNFRDRLVKREESKINNEVNKVRNHVRKLLSKGDVNAAYTYIKSYKGTGAAFQEVKKLSPYVEMLTSFENTSNGLSAKRRGVIAINHILLIQGRRSIPSLEEFLTVNYGKNSKYWPKDYSELVESFDKNENSSNKNPFKRLIGTEVSVVLKNSKKEKFYLKKSSTKHLVGFKMVKVNGFIQRVGIQVKIEDITNQSLSELTQDIAEGRTDLEILRNAHKLYHTPKKRLESLNELAKLKSKPYADFVKILQEIKDPNKGKRLLSSVTRDLGYPRDWQAHSLYSLRMMKPVEVEPNKYLSHYANLSALKLSVNLSNVKGSYKNRINFAARNLNNFYITNTNLDMMILGTEAFSYLFDEPVREHISMNMSPFGLRLSLNHPNYNKLIKLFHAQPFLFSVKLNQIERSHGLDLEEFSNVSIWEFPNIKELKIPMGKLPRHMFALNLEGASGQILNSNHFINRANEVILPKGNVEYAKSSFSKFWNVIVVADKEQITADLEKLFKSRHAQIIIPRDY